MEDVLLSCFVVSNVTVMMLLLIPIEKAVIWSHAASRLLWLVGHFSRDPSAKMNLQKLGSFDLPLEVKRSF